MSAVVPDREHIENLKKSYEQIGPLQNVIVDEYDGKVLVGKHRKFALVDWPEKKINSEGDPLIRELIPIHGNVHRRVSEEETKMRFVRVARILEERGIPKDNICAEMVKILPYTSRYIEKILPKEFKRLYTARKILREDQLRTSSQLSHSCEVEETEISEEWKAEANPQTIADRLDQQRKENLEKIEYMVKVFQTMDNDGRVISNHPFPTCRCQGCPNENICPKY